MAKDVSDVNKILDKMHKSLDHFDNICLVYNIIEVNKQQKQDKLANGLECDPSVNKRQHVDYSSETLSSRQKVKQRAQSVDHLAKLNKILQSG